jgi:hypothetical protein
VIKREENIIDCNKIMKKIEDMEIFKILVEEIKPSIDEAKILHNT